MKNNTYRSEQGYVIDKRGSVSEIMVPFWESLEGTSIDKIATTKWMDRELIKETCYEHVYVQCEKHSDTYDVTVKDIEKRTMALINIPASDNVTCWYFKPARMPSNLVVHYGKVEWVFEI